MTENLILVQRSGKPTARKGHLFFLVSLIMALFSSSAFAQLGVYQFTGAGVCPNQNPNVTTQPANATFSSYSSVNTICQATANLFDNNRWNTGTAIDITEYNQFSVTANSQYLLSLTSISFTQFTSQNNATTWVLRSSINNYTTDIATGTATTTSQTPIITLPAAFANIDSVTFRLYVIGINGINTRWTNGDVTINGTVSAIIPATPNTPTSNSPQCTSPGVTISASGTPPANEAWYWQTSATGTSTANAAPTYNVTTSGTYYLRAQNTVNLAWSTNSASISITITPDVTTPVFSAGGSSTRCQGAGTVTYTASASNTTGITYSLDASSIAGGNTINAATGAVTYAAGWSGTTTVTANAGGCSPKSATHTVTITPSVGTPVFSAGATSIRCQGAGTITYTATATNNSGITYSLDGTSSGAGNSINSSTGAVTYVAGYSGTSVITVSASGCAGTITATHTVTITATVGTPVFSAGATSTRCQGATTVSYPSSASSTTGITYTLDATSTSAGNTINSANGSVTFVTGWVGTSTIVASAAGCNGPKTSTHTVTTTATVGTPVFTSGGASTRCQGAGTVTYTATATTTTGITYSLDAATIAAGNTINSSTGAVTYLAGWSGSTIITATAAGCNGPMTATHTVTVTSTVGTPVFSLGATSKRCVGAGTVTYTATATTSTGITYSLDGSSQSAGNTINSANGTVTFVAGYTGTSIVTATATGCNGPAAATHTITTAGLLGSPVFSLGTSSTRCQAVATITYSATATNNDGLTYSLDASSLAGGNTINSLTGAVTYSNGWYGTSTITVTAAGCGGPLTSTHTVTTTQAAGTPVFAMGASSTRCQNGAILNYSATASNSSAVTYALDATSIAGGNSINASTGAVTYAASWSGTTIITATATGCGSPSSTHTVTTTPVVATPVFSLGSTSSRCQGGNNVTYTATAANSTMLSYSLDPGSLGAGNSINTNTGVVTYVSEFTGTSLITATAQGCFGPTTVTHTVSTTPTVGVPVFALGATSTRCQLAETRTYSATAANSTNITYTLNAASTSAGNTINSTTGAVTFVAGWNSLTVITATSSGCNGSKTATHTVTTNAAVTSPVFTLGTSSTRCQGASSTTYTATANNSIGISYDLDANSIAAGNTINSTTGQVTYVSSWTGTSVIKASAEGCFGPAESNHTVTTNPGASAPVFALGTVSARCQAAATVTYSATAANSTGITYSLNAASTSAGNTINSSTGAITYVAGYTGTTIITATAIGCGGNPGSTHTATTSVAGNPVFYAGASTTRCQGAGTVTYTATSATGFSIVYTLDNTSTLAGNTIDATTGAVTFVSTWSGSSVITATTQGCTGEVSATHTVNTTPTVGTPIFSLGASSTRCQSASTGTYTASATNSTSISYSLDDASLSAGNIINATTGIVTFSASWNGTSIVTATAQGCNGPSFGTHTITISSAGTPVFQIGVASSRCQGANSITYNATTTNASGITYSLNAASLAAGNTINSSTGVVTFVAGFTGNSVVIASTTGCSGTVTATHTVNTTANVSTPVFVIGATSERCFSAGTVIYKATATNSSSIAYSLDAASIAGGNSINATTGTVTYTALWFGTSTITATAQGCNGPKTATHTVTTLSTCAYNLSPLNVQEVIPAGARIINLGINPQTASNGLKPYGLLYQLLQNYVPVKWAINQSKVKDGIDFIHNNVKYRGSAFIILPEYITPAISTLISQWQAKGVIVNTAVSNFTTNIYTTMTSIPRWVLDASQTIISRKFFSDAEIPTSAWIAKDPNQLGSCDDIFILPHADASWNVHKNLYYWNKDYKGALWVACYAISGLENLSGPDITNAATIIKMNFLMKNPTSGINVAVPFNQHRNPSPPYRTTNATHPIMQYVGNSDGAHTNGPEQTFLPVKTGGFRPGTNVFAYDPSQQNVPALSNGPAGIIAFGKAYGDASRGYVMYEAGHHIDNSAKPEEVAATRAFFNYSFFNVREKQPFVTSTGVNSTIFGGQNFTLTATAISQNVNPEFTYQWSSTCGGLFANPASTTTTFTAPPVRTKTLCNITIRVTDQCGRVAFDTKSFEILPAPRAPECNSDVVVLPSCDGNKPVIDVLANDLNPDGFPLTITLIGQGTRGTFTHLGNGKVQYEPAPGFYTGTDQVQYQVCDSRGLCCTSSINVNVNQVDANGCGPDQYFGIIGTINVMRATLISGSVSNKDSAIGDPDGIPGDVTTYSTFSSTTMVYSLNNAIPVAGPLNLYVSSNQDGKLFKVEESTDSLSWKNAVTFTVNSTDNFSQQFAKIYATGTGTRFIRITSISGDLQLDAMEYSVFGCTSAIPVAYDDVVRTYEEVPVDIEIDANDLDPQGLPMLVSEIVSQPAFGRVSINPNNTITYLNFKDQIGGGIDSFTYRICNTRGLCATAKVYVNLTDDNCAPGLYKPIPFIGTTITINPSSDTYISSRNATSNFSTSTSLIAKGKFNDKKRILLDFNLSAIPANALIDSANLLLYRNNAFNNENISVYRATKAWTGASATWNNTNGTTSWTTAGGDFNASAIATANTGFSNNSNITWRVKSLVQGWYYNTYPNNGILLGRNPDNNGTHDIGFASNETATKPRLVVTYRVPGPCTAIPVRAPLAMPDTATTDAITPVTITVTSNDYDYNNSGLNVSLGSTTSKRGGILSLMGNDVIYTPPVPVMNGLDTFRYIVCSSGLCDSVNVFVKVTNAPPGANTDYYTLASNTATTPSSITANVTSNDVDPEGSPLGGVTIVVQPKDGVATEAGSTIVYTPELNFIGSDTLIYKITELTSTDCSRFSDTAYVIFTVTNRPPVATGESVTVNPCESSIIKVTSNDVDPEQGNLTVTIISQPSIGSVVLDNNSTQIKYTPPSGVGNTSTTFQYKVCDDQSPSLCSNVVTATVFIRAIPDNRPPVANRDTFRVHRDEVLYADVLTNDFEPDNQEFSVPLTIVTPATNGTLLPMDNGLIRYIPATRFAGVDSFQYRVADSIDAVANCSPKGPSLSATAWAFIIVQEEPIADHDYLNVVAGTTTNLKVLLNDVFGYNKAAIGTITMIVPPKVGSYSINGNVLPNQSDDDLLYTPNVGYIGKDSLIYQICDMAGNCDTAIVRIKMWPDSDFDGIADYEDIDDDNDGIPDVLEVCGNAATNFACAPQGTDPAADDDNDDIANWKDADYGTLNANGAVAALDNDGDGVPDFLDLDSDNDAIPDVVEAYGVDADGNGVIDNFTDTDKDGLSQNVDANNTGSAGSGNGLGFNDFDGDGIPNRLDLDSDNDGVPDLLEAGGTDANNNGRTDNSVDANFNGLVDAREGINALIKTGADINNDGRADSYPNKNIDQQGRTNPYDLDSDGDGITDAVEAAFPVSVTITNGIVTGAASNGWANSVKAITSGSLTLVNTDARGLPDYLDTDSDNDGISDNIEAQPTATYKLPTAADTDNDGINDVYETQVGIYGGEGITPNDQENDGTPDYKDTDTDNDGLTDLIEASRILTLTQAGINVTDADGDGLVDEFDLLNINTIGSGLEYLNVTNNKMGVNGSFTGPTPGGSNVLLVKTLPSYNDRDWRILNTLTLGNNVWYDFNKNGTKDVNETVLSGVTVKLYHDANGDNIPDGAALLATTTDAAGAYQFNLLSQTKYVVGVTPPIGYTLGYTIATSADPNNGVDNDNNGVTLASGEVLSNNINLASANNTLDFGLKGTGSIGNLVFYDVNANGLQDAGETGIAGATVSISTGGITLTTTTDANGIYAFTELAPATYTIAFTTPAGYVASLSKQGSNNAIDSDPVSGTVNVVLTANENNTDIDAGFYMQVNLGNHVWYDVNLNGIKDAGEPGISGVTVKLYRDNNNDNLADGASIATTTTDVNGAYGFGSLTPGNYIVGVFPPAGYAMITTNGGDPDNNIDNDNNGLFISGSEVRSSGITLSSSGEPTTDGDDNNGNLTVDFGLRATGYISDRVWNDLNGNGIQDAGEPVLAGITVTLTPAGGSAGTVVTDALGNYLFDNLVAGTYTVSFTRPAGYFESPALRGADATKDSDPVNGAVSVGITAGQQRTDIDAGFYTPFTIGNHVWYDFNNNGIKDAGEEGIAGATVKLYKDSITLNTPDGAAIATTTTDVNGVYQFANVASGKYMIAVVLPAGYAIGTTTATSSDPNNGTDNDNNGVTISGSEIRTNNINLNAGITTVDIGLKGTGVISDFVWLDINGNGIQDGGSETGIANASVTISNANGITRSATTNASGAYSFNTLAPGNYTVSFTTPAGNYVSPANRGGNTALDSDPVNGSVAVSITPNQVRTDIDAGFYEGFTIGNTVWFDLNNNGLLDGTEHGINGLTVKLYQDVNADNIPDGVAMATTTTNATGNYLFSYRGPGKYIVSVVMPAGYVMAAAAVTSASPNNNVDNDNNGVITASGEVRTNTFDLTLFNSTIDIGLIGTGSIGNLVFNDLTNNDGVQDAGEPGLAGVSVTLTTAGGATATTTSDASGNYIFPNLIPGTYSLVFTTPAGYFSSPSLQGSDVTKDSDPVSGSVSVSVAANQIRTDIDAGYFVPSTLGNSVWYDYNANGIKDAGEVLISNATVKLYKDVNGDNLPDGAAIATTTTNASGVYQFTGLSIGRYIVGVTATGYIAGANIATSANPGNNVDDDNNGIITNGSEVRTNFIYLDGMNNTLDIGMFGNASVADFVWFDVNGNGIQDVGETGLPGVAITLTNSGGFNKTTTSNAAGFYSFSGLGGDTYTLSFTTPSGYYASPSSQGTDVTKDSDPVNGNIILTLAAGSNRTDVDAGFYLPFNLGNQVWFDLNKNGLFNAGESAIAGATLKLYTDNNGDNITDGAAIATTTTDAAGNYQFSNLYSGKYIVGVALPAGYMQGPAIASSSTPDNGVDNDNNGVTTVGSEVRTNFISVNSNLSTLDIGLSGTSSIGNFVWNDLNGNGLQDGGLEVGISNSNVTLTHNTTGQTLSTTTDAAGNYSFTGLEPGSCTIAFTTPAGFIRTLSKIGANNAIDSDPVNGTITLTLITDQVTDAIDAGFYVPYTLGNHVFYDLNNNGIMEFDEKGVANVPVKLYADNNADNIPDGAALVTTTTSSTGVYQINNLEAGKYIVGITIPAGYVQGATTATSANPNNNVNNDNNGVNLVGTDLYSNYVALTASTDSLDFGLKGTGIIGNYTWIDANGNGIQEAGELPLAGVLVSLKVSTGATINVTTDVNGLYSFTNVAPDTYTVLFRTPTGYILTLTAQGSDRTADSDPTGINNATVNVTIGPGQVNNDIDAGYFLPYIVGDQVFYDLNNNGIKDATEKGIAGVTVKIYRENNLNNAMLTTTTNTNGLYAFTDLRAGNYVIGVVMPTGYVAGITTATSATPANLVDNDNNGVTVVGAELRTNAFNLSNNHYTVDFALKGTASIGDFIWNDLNADGLQDAGEPGLAGVIVTITHGASGGSASVTSNASGNYSFPGLIAGSYTLNYSTPNGFIASPNLTPGNVKTINSDPVNSIVNITLTAGQVTNDIDAGFYASFNLGDVVWYDFNKNGIKDAGEPVISGATVKLYIDANQNNVPDGVATATTTTNASGVYQFSGLKVQSYIVGVTLPAGYVMGVAIATSNNPNNGVDNDNNGVNLVSGEVRSNYISLSSHNSTLDFGFIGTSTISDFVWNDTNGNGIQDAGEPGISGATVTITNSGGATYSSLTNATGNYSLSGLIAGTYTLAFTTPAGYVASPSNKGVDDTKDSDPVSGSVSVTVTAGQTVTDVDAGFYLPYTLGNIVWYDFNNNGLKDANEAGISGATVHLYADANADNIADGAALATTTTDVNGNYSFANLESGNYIVGVVLPAGYVIGTTTGTSATPGNNVDNDNNGVSVVAGELRTNFITLSSTNSTLDIAMKGTGSLGDFVWNDANGNGIQDLGESGLAGVTVTITNGGGMSLITTTNASGIYSFSNLLAPGTYTVAFTTPTGYVASPAGQGADATKDSDPVSGSVSVILTAGQLRTDIDAGFYQPYSIGNHVWYDFNRNGLKDANEAMINGATIMLYADNNADNIPDGAAVGTTTTNASGVYSFTNVLSGKYIVAVVLPTGYTNGVSIATSANPNNNIDNDNNGVTLSGSEVRTNSITMSSTLSSIDIGLEGNGSVGNYVWNDLNGNGIQDVTEMGIEGVTVSITNSLGASYSITTDASGAYLLNALAAGTYTVAFTTPSGYVASAPGRGSDITKDSDPISGSVSLTLTPGQSRTDIDAGFYQPFNIGNLVWYDFNNNGVKDIGEPGIAGATVKLYADANADNVADGAAISTTTTDGSGIYLFSSLQSNNYIVGVVLPTGYTIGATTATSADPNNGVDNDNNGVTLISGEVRSNRIVISSAVNTLDVGLSGTGSIGNFVFNDINGNGIQNAGDAGIPGVAITITNIGGITLNTLTNASGIYTFGSLAPGTYTIGFTTPAAYIASVAAQGADRTIDSDPVSGQVSVTITAAQVKTDIDAGFYQPFSLGNTVWYDFNNNGLLDASEAGISGASVKLYKDVNADNLPDGSAIASTTTDALGNYQLTGLEADKYIVGVVLPTGFAKGATTATSANPNNNTDNDNNGITTASGEVLTNTITLVNINNTIDVGLIGTGSIANFIWLDKNGNHVQDALEPGIAGATVSIINQTGQTATAITNATGQYSFGGLAAGTYTLHFTTPTVTGAPTTILLIPRKADVGTDDLDSDPDPITGNVTVVLGAGEVNTTIDAGFAYDQDDDDDGIPNIVESNGYNPYADDDADGILNYRDLTPGNAVIWRDTNNDGINDFFDFDLDGVLNELDLDSDNDGIPDIMESSDTRAADANKDGKADGVDNDGDGILSTADTDDSVYGNLGLIPKDFDRDGLYNFMDLDGDGDGIVDAIEAGYSGVPVSNGITTGARTNGWANSARTLFATSFTLRNTDGRGKPDYLDIDSDDDGISDNIEGQSTFSFKIASDLDADNDGLADMYEVSPVSFGGGGITPYDHDGDGMPDFIDIDTDNDGAFDINEASRIFSIDAVNINLTDTDGDGLVDEFDMVNLGTLSQGFNYRNVSNSNMGTNGNFDGPLPSGSNVKLVRSNTTGDRDWRTTAVLPLNVTSFTGTLNNNLATLVWKVENENDVDHYELQRSDDAVNFNKVATLKATNAGRYTYSDDLTNVIVPNVYYRVKQVNKAGNEYYTNVVAFKLVQVYTCTVSAFPNPFVSELNLTITSKIAGNAVIKMMDMGGKALLVKTAEIQSGKNQISLHNLGALAHGMFIIEVRLNGKIYAAKVVKQ